jgi:hypothetical protein
VAREPAPISELEKIELRPDGEARFLAAVHAAAKSGPKHRKSVVIEKRKD